MLPIDKFSITKEKTESGMTFVDGKFRYTHTSLLTREQAKNKNEVRYIEDKMRKAFWDMAYKDLREPLDELMYLARWAANSNPSACPEAARIEELTGEINGLLDWRKQLAAKGKEDKSK